MECWTSSFELMDRVHRYPEVFLIRAMRIMHQNLWFHSTTRKQQYTYAWVSSVPM